MSPSKGAASPAAAPSAATTAVGYAALVMATSISAGPLLLGATEDRERLIYLLTSGAVCATALVTSHARFTRTFAASLAPHLLGLVCVALLGARAATDTVPGLADHGAATTLVLLAAGAVAVPLAVRRAWLPGRLGVELVPVFLALGATTFVPAFVSPHVTLAAAACGALAAAATGRVRLRAPRMPRLWEGVFLVVLALLAVDLQLHPVWYLLHHQGYFLGPLAQAQHAHPVLVDTFSVYGVLMFDALSGIFDLVPLGYGTFSLLVGCLTAVWLCGLYVLVRMAGCRRILAAGALLAMFLLLVFAARGNYVEYPSSGVLRFGPPYLALGLWLWSHRAGHRSRFRMVLLLTAVAASAAWSAESAAWTTAAVAAAWSAAAIAERRESRAALRGVGTAVAATAGAALTGIVATYGTTWLVSARKPHLTPYLDIVSAFTVNNVGTTPVTPWSAGMLVGGVAGVSLAATIAALRTARAADARSVGALAGLAVVAVGTLSYFVGNSILNNTIPPAVATIACGAVWAEWALRAGPPVVRRTAVGVAVGILAMLALSTIGTVADKFPRTALAAALPGGAAGNPSLGAALDRLTSNPPVVPEVDGIVTALDRVSPRGEPVIILLNAELAVEVLLRGDRGNALPFGFVKQESHSPFLRRRLLQLSRRVAPGTVLVAPLGPAGARPGVAGLDPFSVAILRRLRMRPLELLAVHRGNDPITRVGVWRLGARK